MDIEAAYRRFMQAYDYLANNKIIIKQLDLVATLGYSEAAISSALKNKDRRFNPEFLKNFARAYSEYINEEWLLTGEGEMKVPDKSLRPHYDAKASAGFMDGISEGKTSAEFSSMATEMKNYDFSIDANGDSMIPRIENGDTLLCRVATDRLNPPIGRICVLDTKEGFVVKVIQNVNEETITLHSLNPAYRDYDIDHSSILGIAEVVGMVRSFM